MASQPSLGTEDGDETRIARDGRPYTRLEFNEHYGEDWHAYWEEASIATAGGAPQPAAAAGPGVPQERPEAQPAPTNAGVSASLGSDGSLSPPSSTGAPPLQQRPRPFGDVLDEAGYARTAEFVRTSLAARAQMAADPDVFGTPGQQPRSEQRAPTIAGATQPGAAAGPDVPGTTGQLPPQAQAATTTAGAPQPGVFPYGVA